LPAALPTNDAVQRTTYFKIRTRDIYIKVENPPGSRIQQFFVNGEEIEAERDYTVAFITSQGMPKKHGSHRRDLPISAIDALRRYFSNHPKVNADLRGTVVVV